MSTRSLIQIVGTLALATALLTACGDVNGGDFVVEGGRLPNWPWPWSAAADVFVHDTFAEEVPVQGHLRIRLDAVNGQVSIAGEPGADSVRVAAELRVGSYSIPDAQVGLDQLEVRVTDRPDEVLVQTLQPHDAKGRQYLVKYTITVPSDLVVDVIQVNGHVTLEGTENSFFVSVVNGSIDTTAGLAADGEIKLTTVNGDIDLRIPTSTSAAFSAFADNGAVTYDNLVFESLVHTSHSLTGTLGDGTGLIALDTGNGSFAVAGF